MTFVSSVPSPTSQVGQSLTWDFASIANQAFETITVLVTINQDVQNGTTVSNIATVTSDTPDDNPDDNTTPPEDTDVGSHAKKLERGDNQWDTRPTFGINHETRNSLLVENGFSFNGKSFTITDNHHTPFAKQSVNIGTENSFVATVYADKKLMVQEFLFGVPEVGMGHLAEMRVEVWYGLDGNVEDVKVVQRTDVIDPTSLSIIHQKVKCMDKDLEEKCDRTMMSAIFLEPLMDQTMAIKAIDFKFRDQTTYLNEGFEIKGRSLNPMETKMIPSEIKNMGLMKITQTEKYSKYWASDDGRIFEMNSFGSFREINKTFERFQDHGEPRTRLHSEFGNVLENEQVKASKIFDSSKLISLLPDSFGYHYEYKERIDDAMKQQMFLEEQKAQDLIEKNTVQARW